MQWYSNTLSVGEREVLVEGTFIDSVIQIKADGKVMYEKSVNLWVHQDINPDDVLMKYQGMVHKIETKKIPLLIESGKL